MRTLKLIVGGLLMTAATACTYYDDTVYRPHTYAYRSDYPYAYSRTYAYTSDYPSYYSYYRVTP
jgi:hypothetical protein